MWDLRIDMPLRLVFFFCVLTLVRPPLVKATVRIRAFNHMSIFALGVCVDGRNGWSCLSKESVALGQAPEAHTTLTKAFAVRGRIVSMVGVLNSKEDERSH